MEGPPEMMGSQGGPNYNTFYMIQEENIQLRGKIAELEKRVSDLTATNEFLLDQNAQLRMGGKSSVTGPPSSMGHGQPGFILQ